MNLTATLPISNSAERYLRLLRSGLLARLFGFRMRVVEPTRRLCALVGVCFAILILSPILLSRALIAQFTAGRIFERETMLGRFRAPFNRLSFGGRFPGRELAVLLNILRGHLSWTGPRPITEADASQVPPTAWVRFSERPGLISLHQLRARVGIAYTDENEHDSEYYYSSNLLLRSFGILVRTLVLAIMRIKVAEAKTRTPTVRLLRIDILNVTMDEALDWILERAIRRVSSQICFVNTDCLNVAFEHAEYQSLLRQADGVFPDGIGIRIACRVVGRPLVANVNGTDLFPRLCQKLAETELSIFLLGARENVVTATGREMKKRYRGLRIAGTHHGYFAPSEESRVIQEINASGASILLVGMGAPHQDLWLARNAAKLSPVIRIGVGGLFDFYSGRIPRAPQWVREIGMEWAWRLALEPMRMWRRYIIGNPKFLLRVWRSTTLDAQGS